MPTRNEELEWIEKVKKDIEAFLKEVREAIAKGQEYQTEEQDFVSRIGRLFGDYRRKRPQSTRVHNILKPLDPAAIGETCGIEEVSEAVLPIDSSLKKIEEVLNEALQEADKHISELRAT